MKYDSGGLAASPHWNHASLTLDSLSVAFQDRTPTPEMTQAMRDQSLSI